MIKYFTGEIRRTSVYVFLFKANKSFMMYRVAGSWAITGLSLTSERMYLICAKSTKALCRISKIFMQKSTGPTYVFIIG